MDSVVALIVQLFPARDDSEVANNDVVRMTMLPMTMTMILTKRVAKRRADDDDIIVDDDDEEGGERGREAAPGNDDDKMTTMMMMRTTTRVACPLVGTAVPPTQRAARPYRLHTGCTGCTARGLPEWLHYEPSSTSVYNAMWLKLAEM